MRRVTIVESLSAKIEEDATPCEFSTHLLSVSTPRMIAVPQFSNWQP
jgi:hypothetical protein